MITLLRLVVRPRVLARGGLAIVIATALPGPAGAATVSQTTRVERGECAASRSCLTYRITSLQAAPGERNRIEIVAARREDATGRVDTLRFRERGPAPLHAGAGCTGEADASVLCTFAANGPGGPSGGSAERGVLRVRLGDGDDTLRVADPRGRRLRSLGTGTVIDGGPGDDRIDGVGTVRGGAGDDRLQGGPGADVLEGGPGADRIAGLAGDDFLRGGAGRDRLLGGPGSDDLRGGTGADHLAGGPGFDDLRGDAGNDRLDGGTSPDHVYGGAGNDRLSGGSDHARDDVRGGPGLDRARRGAGDAYREIEWFVAAA